MHHTISVALRHAPPSAGRDNGADYANVVKMVSENPVIVIGTRGCCMCYVVQKLFQGLGVSPPVFEVDDADLANALWRKIVCGSGGEAAATVDFPVVFVGGKFFGGLERVMATHITGELVPILKDVGALWL